MAPPSLVSKISMFIPEHQAPSENFINDRTFSKDSEEVKFPWQHTFTSNLTASNGLLVDQELMCQGHNDINEDKEQEQTITSGLLEKRLISYEELLFHRSQDDAWISVDGKVYDVTQFLETHPGGQELILEHLESGGSKDAGPLMRGGVNEDGHSHSKAAFRMLEQFLIGSIETTHGPTIVKEDFSKKYCYHVDLTKPIVAQVGYLGADYDEWVHDPIVCKESPRFFEKDIHEFFTKTNWWMIPIVWCPVAFIMIYTAVVKEGVPLTKLPGLMAYGILIWSLLEYLLHRFLFHMKTSSFWGNTLHYLLHGFHHKHPMDGSRLVFPPAFASIICIWVWFLMGSWLAAYPNKLVIYASALLGYVAYDLTHYFLHFGTAFTDKSRKMKRYHLNHHFKDQKNGYGITSLLWDWVFKTLPSTKITMD